MKIKTNRKRMRQRTKEMNQWLKAIRNKAKIKDIWEVLAAKLRGHYNYYGISSNRRSIQTYYYQTIHLTFKWMNRRSQKQSFNWQQFTEYLKLYPLPKPALVYSMYDLW